jgi:transposase-like protein
MPFHYSTDFRRRACERLGAGEPVSKVAKELSVSSATLFRWKKQLLIDIGQIAGVKSYEVDELARAQRTIRDLESELELVKAASALFNGEVPANPKGGCRLLKP